MPPVENVEKQLFSQEKKKMKEHGRDFMLSMLTPNLTNCSRDDMLDYLENGWRLYETMMASLSASEDYTRIPNQLRRPLIFYLGHTATFYLNKLIMAGVLTDADRINPEWEEMFAVGVDEMSWDDMSDDHFDWPTVEQTWEFRRSVYELVLKHIKTVEWNLPITWEKPKLWCIIMSIEHERIHLETSSVLIREMPIQFVKEIEGWSTAPSFGYAPRNNFVTIPGGKVVLGKDTCHPAYGWDAEFGREEHDVAPFEVTQFKITNAEFLVFVNEKGYERKELWTEEGWSWVTDRKITHPHFWAPIDASKYQLRTQYAIIDMPFDWPVEVNYLEAKAYCNWVGGNARLITEPEWRAMTGIEDQHYNACESEDKRQKKFAQDPGYITDVNDAKNLADTGVANIDLRYGSPSPVNYFAPNKNGIYDAFGNVWEWSESHFDALPGFKAHNLYLDFSSPCFDNRHNMILGGSYISTGNEASVNARYAFRRHFFQHSGFRVVKSCEADQDNVYETEISKRQYLAFHYGTADEVLPFDFGTKEYVGFPGRCAALVVKHASEDKRATVLDIGCAVGRSSFELAPYFNTVLGTDYSGNFVSTCDDLKAAGEVEYLRYLEGELTTKSIASVAHITPAHRERCHFVRGDAHDLTSVFDRLNEVKGVKTTDAVLAANLLDRLSNPRAFLDQLPALVNVGGVVVLTSPYTWLEQFTPKVNWLGGYVGNDGKEVSTLETLKTHLAGSFDFVEEQNIPMLIPETHRKFQWTVVNATVWRRT